MDMKQKLLNGFLFLLIGVSTFISCKKEYSCENCLDNVIDNKPPIAAAGPDITITLPLDSILLNGSNSTDPDGTITRWQWTKISGPASFIINSVDTAITTTRLLVQGIYQFELKVTDNQGAIASDTLQVTVNKAGVISHPPVACAGPDQTITLPQNSVLLDGSCSSDPDQDIRSYAWTKISGPSFYQLANANATQTQLNNLVQGTYQLELKVTDAGGLIDQDTVTVTVTLNVIVHNSCTNCSIAFVSNRDGNAEIYVCASDGSNITRLTNDPGIDEYPIWSPSGSHIAFISDRSGSPELYIMNADGSNPVRTTFSGNCIEHPSWSPDETKIVYATFINGSIDLWVLNIATGSTSFLFGKFGFDYQPSWSPDGTKILLASDFNAYDIVSDIFMINEDGTNLNSLTGNIYDYIDYFNPVWSPNGNKIALHIVHTSGVDQYEVKLGTMNPDGNALTPIISNVAIGTNLSWSADGTRIAYTSLSTSGKDVSWVSADGLTRGTIVTNGWNADWQH
jgi:hypothetical protein